MKKTKIISGLMAMAMTVMSLGISASAAESVDVNIGSATVKAGEEFSVTVEMGAPSSGLSSIDFAINYDSSALTITDVSLGKLGDTGAKAKEGDLGDTLFSWYKTDKQIVIVWATGLTDSQYWVKGNGEFLTITGKVDKNASGTIKLEGGGASRAIYPDASEKASAYLSAVGADGTTDYTANFSDGKIVIDDGSSKETDGPKDDIGDNDADWGNVDCKDGVDVSDAVLLARFNAEDSAATISAQGKINADVDHDGQYTASDVTKILKYIAKIISKDDLAKKG